MGCGIQIFTLCSYRGFGMRYLLFSCIVIIVFLFYYKIKNESFGCNTNASISQHGNIYSEENRNGILYVNIIIENSYVSVNTRASTYSKYAITQLNPHYILLNSSDIGVSIITDKISSKWDIYEARHIKVNSYDVYVVITESRHSFKRESDGILVLFKKGNDLKTFKLEGDFHLAFSPCNTENDYLSISTKLHRYIFKVGDTISLTVN